MIYNKKIIWKHGSKPEHIKDNVSWVQLGYVTGSDLFGKELQDSLKGLEPRFFMYHSFDTSKTHLNDSIKGITQDVEMSAQARGFSLAESIIKKEVNFKYEEMIIKEKLTNLADNLNDKNIDIFDLMEDIKIIRRQ